MGFSEFLGNEHIVTALRGMLGAGRVPSALLFTGPRGVGKYTLARMFAQATNCERMTDDFCGECATCQNIAQLAHPQPLIERGLAERGENPDTATVERTPLLLQTNPDVCVIVPDPVRLRTPVARPVIRMGQLRAVQRAAYFRPGGRRRVFILDGAETMRWDNANIFLKILEEPPESATLILLASSADLLLRTIQSRCLRFYFAPLPIQDVENFLKRRADLKPAQRKLAAQLSQGSIGTALEMDLEESSRLRRDVLRVIELGMAGKPAARLFALTAQLAKNEQVPFENILELFYSLLTDLLELSCDVKTSALRNPDLRRELEELSPKATLSWVGQATKQLDQLHGRLRRNINRQLGLENVAVSLAGR